ncbi:hypothetical protein, partial [Crocosphaera chwakensis]
MKSNLIKVIFEDEKTIERLEFNLKDLKAKKIAGNTIFGDWSELLPVLRVAHFWKIKYLVVPVSWTDKIKESYRWWIRTLKFNRYQQYLKKRLQDYSTKGYFFLNLTIKKQSLIIPTKNQGLLLVGQDFCELSIINQVVDNLSQQNFTVYIIDLNNKIKREKLPPNLTFIESSEEFFKVSES